MALDAYEREKLDKIAEAVARIDERTERAQEEMDRRFTSAHARIDDVRDEARRAAQKSGGAVGAGAGTVAAGVVTYLRDFFGT